MLLFSCTCSCCVALSMEKKSPLQVRRGWGLHRPCTQWIHFSPAILCFMQLSIVCLYGERWGNWWVLCKIGDFELRFGSNNTCSVGVYREIVINSSPRGGAIGFSTFLSPTNSCTRLHPLIYAPPHISVSGTCAVESTVKHGKWESEVIVFRTVLLQAETAS
jgi:hypothetical protein